ITYRLLHSLIEHSCINPKSLTFDYLDEKLVDTGLMKFLGLCPSSLSWYLEFLPLHSPPPRPFLRPMFSLHKSKGSMIPRKSRLCGTIPLPADGPIIRYLASAPISLQSIDLPLWHCGTPPSPPPV
ncbi:hypothetical protein BHE74_00045902, partial [Ensete ventricosum]